MYQNQKSKRNFSLLLSLCMLLSILFSILCMEASAAQPNVSTVTYVHTACKNYNIYSSKSSQGDAIDYVTKSANRTSSSVSSKNYAYSTTTWISIQSDDGNGGYTISANVCPKTRCYKATSSIPLLTQPSASASTQCTIASGSYLQVMDVVSGMSYVRIRTGSNTGTCGYVTNSYISIVNG